MKKAVVILTAVFVLCPVIAFSKPLRRVPSNERLYSSHDMSNYKKKDLILRGPSGDENINNPPPFDFEDASKVKNEAEELIASGKIENTELEKNIESTLMQFQSLVEDCKNFGTLSSDQTFALMDSEYNLQNLLGLASKTKNRLKSKRFVPITENGKLDLAHADYLEADKINTGWIIDQKIYDPTVEKIYPSMPVDIRSNDEGASDLEVDDGDYGTGLVWEVQSFYFSDPVLDEGGNPTHPSPSYSIAVFVSPDGGSTWLLYEVIYDENGQDVLNPRLAIDILPAGNRSFIAFEYVNSATDHDIYVWSESFLSEAPGIQITPVASSTLMERNPDIASDYHQGQTSYRVVVFEKEASAGSYNYDIYSCQSVTAGGSQLMLNPGFESGNVNWTASNTGIINNTGGSGTANTGTLKAQVGRVASVTDTIYQDVAIPSGASATLSLYLRITTAESSGAYDDFAIKLKNTSGTDLVTLAEADSSYAASFSTYQWLAFDVSAFAGQTVRVWFESVNDSLYVTSYFVDDVALDLAPDVWTSAVAVAADSSSEHDPSISNGASGSSSFTQYMHLAYNYDTFSTTQLLLNSGFESGNNGNWTVNSSGDIDNTAGHPRTGTYCAWLAGVNSYTDFIYQDVTVPADAVGAKLGLYLKMTSAEGTTTAYDNLYIQLRDTSNNILTTLKTISNVDKNTYTTYQPLELDILPYAGQTLRIYLLATTNSTNITSFFIDDTYLNITAPSGYEIRYAKAAHPGGTAYPVGLQSATKLTVLSNSGVGWEYGPPSIVSTHGGGSSSWTQARVAVAADQHFPADNPSAGDLDRHQICYAWNMCNGGTTCGTMTCGSDTLSKNWQESWFYDGRGDERLPSLIQDGAGLPTSGLSIHSYIFMAYFHRAADSPQELGDVQLVLADPSDETCNGFIYSYWYYFTASYTASDADSLVSPVPRTINAFNYWDGWPGVSFNKRISHLSGGTNDDVFCTTLGDNYTFFTFATDYLDLVISLNGETYATRHTFPWPAGYKWDVTAVTPQEEGGYHYTFMNWSNSQTQPTITVASEFCDPVNPCPEVNFIATYSECLLGLPLPVIDSITDQDACSQNGVIVAFTAGAPSTSHALLVDDLEVAAGISSPYLYNPGDRNSHKYQVREYSSVNCFTDSLMASFADADNTPSAPVITEISNYDTACSLRITFTMGAPAARHDLYVDGGGTPSQTGITSPAYYIPSDGGSHTFSVRAVNGSCYANSTSMAGSDPNCGAVVVPPPEIADGTSSSNAQTWPTATQAQQVQAWPSTATATGYRLYKGLASNLSNLTTTGNDFCDKDQGVNLSADLTSDNAAGVAGRCYFYLVVAYNSAGEGSAGYATGSVQRILNTTGTCP